MPETESARALLGQMDAEQRRLAELLSGKDPSVLTERPPSGKWSVIENVRHLLFAEEAHLRRFVPGGSPMSAIGLPPDGMRRNPRVAPAGTVETASLEDVLAAWHLAHTATSALAPQDTEAVRKALEKNLRHLRTHIRVVERLLRASR